MRDVRARFTGARAWLARQRAATLVALLLGLFLLAGSVVGSALYLFLASGLPTIQDVEKDYRPPIITRVLDARGRLIGEFAVERRIVVPVAEMPRLLVEAFVAAEDQRFFEHKGIDLVGLVRAAFANIEGQRQGGSTITMQVAKTFFLADAPRDLRYKLRQILLAYRLERHLTKDQILYLYLNQIYLGHGAYGVGAAAQVYFGKTVRELTLPEVALLAGLPRAPSTYSPYTNPEAARERRAYVLARMRDEGYITAEQAEAAARAPLGTKVKELDDLSAAAFFAEHVRQYLVGRYGTDAVYKEGLTVHTTADLDLQRAAQKAVERGLRALDKREGYRGPLARLSDPRDREAFLAEESRKTGGVLKVSSPEDPILYKALVTRVDPKGADLIVGGSVPARLPLEEMVWARKPDPDVNPADHPVTDATRVLAPNDVVLVSIRSLPAPPRGGRAGGRGPEGVAIAALEQQPLVQGALLAMDPHTGAVRAMVGGFDFSQTQFNRAIQARRQPGSAFKPIIYAAALDSPKGFTPASIIVDSPFIEETEELQWRPKNFDGRFWGPTTLRQALTFSRNVVSIKLLEQIGAGYAIDYARTLGITSPLARDLSLALGSSGVSLLELVRAYAVFAAQGNRPEPLFVTKVVDRDGQVLEENHPVVTERVISPETAFIMTNMLKGVVQDGTAQRVKALGRPVAGKTGTTNDLNDAWFIGYTPDLVAGVWVGFDDLRTLGWNETGARAASPIWLDFMQEAVRGQPVRDFLPVPPGVVFAKIDPKSGKLARPGAPASEVIYESFKEGTAPTEVAGEEPAVPGGPVDLRALGGGDEALPPPPVRLP
ncbi:MAG TPA: PBP1A family penicillin-binding protein [Thermodesulfobacteriota bacterium]|nr:PBP1A family penicillin-binding protein [Thermodesulfobacteriota bacterium]